MPQMNPYPTPINHIKLPQLSHQNQMADPFAKDVYSSFIGHFYNTGTQLTELKIFEAIQVTAITMGISNAFTAKTLVELGLRAPRKAFPASFLDFADKSGSIKTFEGGLPVSPAITALHRHWQYLRENPSAITSYRNI